MVLAIPHQPTPDITYCPQTYNFPPNEKLTKKPHLNLSLSLSGELSTIARTHDTFTFTRENGKIIKLLFSALLAILGVRCAVIIVILIV